MKRTVDIRHHLKKTLAAVIVILCAQPMHAHSLTPVISEIMFNPSGNENAREFVEIINLAEEPVSLEGWFIGDGTALDSIVPAEGDSWIVPAGTFALIMDPDYFADDDPYDIPPGIPLFTVDDRALGDRGLSNSTGEPVLLVSGDGDTLSMVYYSLDCAPGHSWERILPHGSDLGDNFHQSQNENGTPGRENSVTPPAYNPALDDHALTFSPTHPHLGDDLMLHLSYRNAGLEPLADVSVTVRILPDNELGMVTFSEAVSPGASSEQVDISVSNCPGGSLGFVAAIVASDLTTSTGDDTISVNLTVTLPPETLLLNEIMAAPSASEPEWVEIFNRHKTPVDLYAWRIGDRVGAPHGIVDRHALIPGYGYVVLSAGPLPALDPGIPLIPVESFPALNNDGDTVYLYDYAASVVDSMTYEKTVPGQSLELISPDRDGDPSGWDTCVDPSGSTPCRQNSIYYSYVDDEKGNGGKMRLTVDPNPFEETVTLSYRLPFPLARVRLTVYDRRGRFVATLRDSRESGSEWTGTWDGRSDGSRLPAGPYILNLEAIDKRTGTVHTKRKTLVIGRKL